MSRPRGVFSMLRGRAAPRAKRKRGKTRSTQVMPNVEGLSLWVGGGSWAWYIQAGRVPQGMRPLRAIPRRATPRKASRALDLTV